MSDEQTPLRVALLGCGVVGSQVARRILQHGDDLASRIGRPIQLIGIAVRDTREVRDPEIPTNLLTTDTQGLIEAGPDIVIELFGGIEPARTMILLAIGHGASIITANKALLAEYGPEIFEAADAAEVDVYFEAAVGGAIPIIRPIRESLAGDHVSRVLGIVNGTTNYVLDRMSSEGMELEDAVAAAQELGYAEADPTADIDGFDAAAKAAILASLAFHTRVGLGDVMIEGVRRVTADDVAWARRTGHTLKLLAIAERGPDGVTARVHPALVPKEHPLASVGGAFNAVFVQADAAGPLMFYGQGAGGVPTSSAVLGDLVAAARNRVSSSHGPPESAYADLPVLPASRATTRYQVRFTVPDQPGVLAQVAKEFADHGVSIETLRQVSGDEHSHSCHLGKYDAQLVITTHEAREDDLAETVKALAQSDPVCKVLSVLRVEGR